MRFVEYLTGLRDRFTRRNQRGRHACEVIQQNIVTMPAQVLILGPRGSGKTTIVKHMHLQFAPSSFDAESRLWRPVVLLNLIESFVLIMDALNSELAVSRLGGAPTTSEHRARPLHPSHVNRLNRLVPLRNVLQVLKIQVSTAFPDELSWNETSSEAALEVASKFPSAELRTSSRNGYIPGLKLLEEAEPLKVRVMCHEVALKSETAFCKASEVAGIVADCAEDMHALWTDPDFQRILASRCLYPGDGPGFFLDDIRRVASLDYEPTRQDIMKAHLSLDGMQEYTVTNETDGSIVYRIHVAHLTRRWLLHQNFEEIGFIFFIVPLGDFDEPSLDNPGINRLQDSLQLWEDMWTRSENQLKRLPIFHYFVKHDTLDAKLKHGVQFVNHFPDYGDRPNEVDHVTGYTCQLFRNILSQYNQTKPYKDLNGYVFTATQNPAMTIPLLQDAFLSAWAGAI